MKNPFTFNLLTDSRTDTENRTRSLLTPSIPSDDRAKNNSGTASESNEVSRNLCGSLLSPRPNARDNEGRRSLIVNATTDQMSQMWKRACLASVVSGPQSAPTQVCELQRLADSPWNRQAVSSVEKVASKLLACDGISEDWVSLLLQVTRQAVLTVYPQHIARGDAMDVGRYIHIAQVCSDRQYTEFVEGLVVVHSTPSLQLPVNPRILFIKDTHQPLFCEELAAVSVMLAQRFLKQVKANLLITTSGVLTSHEQILEQVHPRLCELLARASGGKPVTAVDRLAKNNKFVGRCKTRRRAQPDEAPSVVFEDFADRSLTGTIILGAPNRHLLPLLETLTRQLLIVCRDQFLQAAVLDLLQVDASVLPEFDRDFSASVFVVHKNSLCGLVKRVTGQCYSEEDQPLGKFIASLNKSSLCTYQHTDREHKLYYLRGTRRILIRVSEEESKTNAVFVFRNCAGCQTVFANPLSEAASELSMYSFFNLLLSEAAQNFACAHCYSPALRELQLVFKTRTEIITLECEPNLEFGFVPRKNLALPKKPSELFCQDLLVSIKKPGIRLLGEFHKEVLTIIHAIDAKLLGQDTHKKLLAEGHALQLAISQDFVDLESRKLRTDESHLSLQQFRHAVLANVLRVLPKFMSLQEACLQSLPRKSGFWAPSKSAKQFEVSATFSAILNQELLDLNKNNPLLGPGVHFSSIPVSEEVSLSAVAYTLNSQEYQDAVVVPFLEQSTDTRSMLGSSVNELFRFQFGSTPVSPGSSKTSWRVKAYFVQQLHCVRLLRCGSEQDFLRSISAVLPGDAAKLAKKGSFRFTHDRKYIVKSVLHKEMKTFIKIGPRYFEYIRDVLFEGRCSLLVQVLGAFRVKTTTQNGLFIHTEYLFVFENLAYSLPRPSHVYDLKGTLNKRRKVNSAGHCTKMDLNFTEDFEGLPVTLDRASRRVLEQAVDNDTRFLASQNIIDYSLLTLLAPSTRLCAMGIIDYMEQYTIDKAIESGLKQRLLGDLPTVTKAEQYSERFHEHLLFKYFI